MRAFQWGFSADVTSGPAKNLQGVCGGGSEVFGYGGNDCNSDTGCFTHGELDDDSGTKIRAQGGAGRAGRVVWESKGGEERLFIQGRRAWG
jgi:hypothetical protein